MTARRSHPPEAQSSPAGDSTSSRTPRQEGKLARLEEIRQSHAHLGDPTPLPTTVQGIFHWDLADQVEELVAVGQSDPALAFIMRIAALCSLPRKNPGQELQYVRRNGPYELTLTATGYRHHSCSDAR